MILELLKLVAEKFLLQGIIATIPTLLVKAYFPNIFMLSDLLTPTGYVLLVWCASFVVVKVIESLFCFIKGKLSDNKIKHYYSKKNRKDFEKNLKSLWDKIDSYLPDERKLIIDFIKSDNLPISTIQLAFCPHLSRDGFLVKTYTKIKKELPQQSETQGIHLVAPITRIPCGEVFKLKDDIYQILKYSYYKYGKISNFEIDENSEIYTDEYVF